MIHRFWPALLFGILVGCASGERAPAGPPPLPADVLNTWLEQEHRVLILDVRPDSLFDAGRIANAIRSSGRRVSDLRAVLPRNPATPIVVVDEDGSLVRDPENLAAALSEFGFPKVYWLEGGIAAWREKGYELIGYRVVPGTRPPQ